MSVKERTMSLAQEHVSFVYWRPRLERELGAKVITYESEGLELPGGMCSCCGGGPEMEGPGRPWLIFRAGLCDSDGVFYGQLCEGCLDDVRAEAKRRGKTVRDERAAVIADLLGDDIDGAEALMEDEYDGTPE